MKITPACIIYSRDDTLANRLQRIASGIADLQFVATQLELEERVTQFGDCILFADLRAPCCLDVLTALKEKTPQMVIIALGVERSDPMLSAESLNPYAMLSLDPDRRAFQNLLKQAIECHLLRHKTRVLEDEINVLRVKQTEPAPQTQSLSSEPLQNFIKAQQNFDDMSKLFGSIVEGLAITAKVSRAGIFINAQGKDEFLYQAGIRCLSSTQRLSFSNHDPFVRWLEMNPHLIYRKTLDTIFDPEERAMLKLMLDSLGAEIIIPLYTSGYIKGWVFVGRRSTGIPFDLADLEALTGLAEHISTTLEKAYQYEETALQKASAETLLHTIPFGIITCDENGIIRWFNNAAQEILHPEDKNVIGLHAESLGTNIADMLNRALQGQFIHDFREWSDPRTKRMLSAETRCLTTAGSRVGVMMMLRDITVAKQLKEKGEQLERAIFWNELASSMSHEIRNPLVAIKTFSQLLPERYEDADFRAEFSELVTKEVDQLNHIIDKINEFANPPKPEFKPINIHRPIEHAVTRIQSSFNHENLKIQLSSEGPVQQIIGDIPSLEECFYHLLMNAVENLNNEPDSRINVIVKDHSPVFGSSKVYVIIADNGSGIDTSVRDKVLSPFSTIKARGLGLGLPIAKRAVIDHNGQMDIETSSSGTTITISFPILEKEHK